MTIGNRNAQELHHAGVSEAIIRRFFSKETPKMLGLSAVAADYRTLRAQGKEAIYQAQFLLLSQHAWSGNPKVLECLREVLGLKAVEGQIEALSRVTDLVTIPGYAQSSDNRYAYLVTQIFARQFGESDFINFLTSFHFRDQPRSSLPKNLKEVLVLLEKYFADRIRAQVFIWPEGGEQVLEYVLRSLPEDEHFALRNYYGIGCEPMSLEDIGKTQNVTRERVRQNIVKHVRLLASNNLLRVAFGRVKPHLNDTETRQWEEAMKIVIPQ